MAEISPNRILIVDDDPLLTKSLRDILEEDGHLVTIANSGRAAIDVFQSALETNQPFALVISDLAMQGIDGRQVIGAIKASSPGTPVILLTGWGQWFEAKSGVPLEANYILKKPPKLTELREALAQCLPKP